MPSQQLPVPWDFLRPFNPNTVHLSSDCNLILDPRPLGYRRYNNNDQRCSKPAKRVPSFSPWQASRGLEGRTRDLYPRGDIRGCLQGRPEDDLVKNAQMPPLTGLPGPAHPPHPMAGSPWAKGWRPLCGLLNFHDPLVLAPRPVWGRSGPQPALSSAGAGAGVLASNCLNDQC
jgi:hypothetical protein